MLNQPTTARINAVERLLAFFAACTLHLWARTLRIQAPQSTRSLLQNAPPQIIFTLWHNRLFLAFLVNRYFKKRTLHGMISTSKDGGILVAIAQHFGLENVRGSSGKGGAHALRAATAILQSGGNIAITPDGSRGPKYELKPGVVKLCMDTGTPLLLIGAQYSRKKIFNSWDAFQLPYPFATVHVRASLLTHAELSAIPQAKRIAYVQQRLTDIHNIHVSG